MQIVPREPSGSDTTYERIQRMSVGIPIGHLAAHIGMSKSVLYAHFRSKEQLQLETIDTALEIFTTEVTEPADAIADPLARLEATYDRFLDHVGRRVFPGGCFFASVEAEFD